MPIDYRSVFESAPGLYLLLDPQLVIVGASQAYLDATMTRREQIVGKGLFEVFPDNPDDPQATGEANLWESLDKVRRHKQPHRMADQKYDIARPDGSFEARYWRPLNTPMLDEMGDVALIIHSVVDITDEVRAQESAASSTGDLQRFFELSLDMLCIANADGYFKRLSPAFERTLGWSVQDLTTRPFSEFVHPDDLKATMDEVERQVVAGEPVLTFENRYLHKDGSYRVLSWKSVPHEGGFMYAVARDVTERRSLESSLVEATEEARRANRAKSEFLSRMSHELRTPLNGILGFAQLIELQYDDPNLQDLTKQILKGGHHLLGLINEILDIARIEAGKLAVSLEPVVAKTALDQAASLVAPQANAEGVSIDIDGACEHAHVTADRQRLTQVFINLISNAVKYNRKGGSITVSCEDGPDGTYRIAFKDTGIGIPAESQHLLFQPFERIGQETTPGTGLGLALSRQLVELMGGSLVLESTSEKGSTFVVTLRQSDSPIEAASASLPNGGGVSFVLNARILCIEDNLSNLKLLEHVFENLKGIELIPAMQGSIGLELARQHVPDLVLLDVHLPDIDGIEVLRRLRADEATAEIPVIVISADATTGQRKRLLGAGALAYITKPIDITLLTATIEEALRD